MNDQAYKTMMQIDRKYGEKQAKIVQKDKSQKHRTNYNRMSAKDILAMEDDMDGEDYQMFSDDE